MAPSSRPLYLDYETSRDLLLRFGPSLALWRAAEIAMLRRQEFVAPTLDAGCGDGIVTSHVLARVDVGLDPGNGTPETGPYERFVASSIEEAPLPDRSFGTILSNSVVEHVGDVEAFLAAAARLLRPGGRLILTTPSDRFNDWLTLPLAPYAAWRNRALSHRHLWPAPRWSDSLRRAGLRPITIEPYLRRPLVTFWDLLELTQTVWIEDRRLMSLVWRRLSPSTLHRLARLLARCDLGATGAGGGHLIVAEKSAG
ncbi:MAG TPA: methyltransferase domain-containing protein [Chloroflexota bacterium]|nr:methyltransferase domain-containing protein [Chloroflexota bacterium]